MQQGVSTVRVVRFQDLPDDDKEVKQPAGPQRLFDRMMPFTFAKLIATHMRMHNVAVGGGWIGINSHDLIGRQSVGVTKLKLDLEGTEIDAFQFNAVRYDREGSVLSVIIDLGKLVFQGLHITQHVHRSRHGDRFLFGLQQLAKGLGFPSDLHQHSTNLFANRFTSFV